MALEMRQPNTSKLYFYEACQIVMKAIIRFSHRYAELAREMAAKEKDATRKAELISLAETCEWVPEHPARNLREAMQCHFLCHLCAELEQIGCGYSEAFLGQNFEPFYQRDKAAGLVTYDDAVFMFENLVDQAERDQLLLRGGGRQAELGRPGPEHHPRGLYRGRWRCDRGDGLRDPRRLRLPGVCPSLRCRVRSPRTPRAS